MMSSGADLGSDGGRWSGGSDRGVSPVIGMMLVVGILVLAVATWQTNVVPSENGEHEFEHYQSVSDDLTQLRNNLLLVASRGTTIGTDIKIGTRYPSRVVLINPPPVEGRLRTNHTQSVSFENVRAVDTEPRNVRRVWQDRKQFDAVTKSLEFTADYNYAREGSLPPIVVTGQTVYRAAGGRAIPMAEQTLIDGNRIRFVFVSGNLTADGQSASVVTDAASMSLRTVTLTGNGSGDPIELRFDPPAKLTATDWVEAFGEEIQNTNSRVVGATADAGQVVLELDPAKTYHVQLAMVSVGETDPDADSLEPAYVVDYRGNNQSRGNKEVGTVTVEVRDKFNNPVREANVTFEVTDGEGVLLDVDGNEVAGTRTVSTDAEGRASQTVKVTEQGEDIKVEANVTAIQDPSLGTTTLTIQTPAPDNPVQLAGVRYRGGDRVGNQIELTFENVIDQDRSITQFRLGFYQGGSPENGTIEGQSFTVGGNPITLSPQLTIPAGQTATFAIDFDSYNPSSGNWFVITVVYETGDNAQYFTGLG